MSMLKAWVGMVLLAEDDWFYASPTISSAPPDQTFGTSAAAPKARKEAVGNAEEYHMLPVGGQYQCLTLDFRLCRFDLSSARRGANGCVVNARFLPPSIGKRTLHVVCKVVDALRYPDAANSLDDEACAYAALQNLQGKVILTLYGFYRVWGILKLLALVPVGNAIPEGEEINRSLHKKMKAALQRIHSAGFLHGDIARRIMRARLFTQRSGLSMGSSARRSRSNRNSGDVNPGDVEDFYCDPQTTFTDTG
jgi:hypothetical protein